jgi:hypothetical protein
MGLHLCYLESRTSVRLDDPSNPPTISDCFPSVNYPGTAMMTNDYVVFIFIRVLNNERMVTKHYVHQPCLHCLHGVKYNTLLYNDNVMFNESHIVVQLKTINYSHMCLTHVLRILHIGCMFRHCTLQQNLVPVAQLWH